jgi:hypothetical protein
VPPESSLVPLNVTNVSLGAVCVAVAANSRKDNEPTSGLEPLSCSSYELAVIGSA